MYTKLMHSFLTEILEFVLEVAFHGVLEGCHLPGCVVDLLYLKMREKYIQFINYTL